MGDPVTITINPLWINVAWCCAGGLIGFFFGYAAGWSARDEAPE